MFSSLNTGTLNKQYMTVTYIYEIVVTSCSVYCLNLRVYPFTEFSSVNGHLLYALVSKILMVVCNEVAL